VGGQRRVVDGALVGFGVGVHGGRGEPRDGMDQGVLGVHGDLVGGDEADVGGHDDLAFGAQVVADPAQPYLPDVQ
jgi:hypothetical protein